MRNENDQKSERNTRFQLIGWLLFVICAVLFMISSIINRDLFAFMGSVVFLIACIVFLIPLLKLRE